MSFMFSFMILCLTVLASLVDAIPFIPRDVVSPPITSPTSQTVWNAGEKQTLTWDISNLPATSSITNPIGMVVLGFLANGSENLMLDHPLAKGFKLTDAKVEITVPSVPTRNDYIVVLFGDSGNASPEFTINGISSPEDTPSSSPTSAVHLVSVSPSPPITTASSGSTTPFTPVPPITTASSDSTISEMTTLMTTSTPTSIPMPTVTSPSSAVSSSTLSSTAPSSTASSSAAQKMHGLDSTMAYCFGGGLMVFLAIF